jgi:GH24 family phage-related lysozyme (muramidase)
LRTEGYDENQRKLSDLQNEIVAIHKEDREDGKSSTAKADEIEAYLKKKGINTEGKSSVSIWLEYKKAMEADKKPINNADELFSQLSYGRVVRKEMDTIYKEFKKSFDMDSKFIELGKYGSDGIRSAVDPEFAKTEYGKKLIEEFEDSYNKNKSAYDKLKISESEFVKKINNPESKLTPDEASAAKYYKSKVAMYETIGAQVLDKHFPDGVNTKTEMTGERKYAVPTIGGSQSLADIARRNNISVEALAKANNIDLASSNGKSLSGTELKIPNKDVVPEKIKLSDLANQYHTSVDALKKLNPSLNNLKDDNVPKGKEFIIPSVPAFSLDAGRIPNSKFEASSDISDSLKKLEWKGGKQDYKKFEDANLNSTWGTGHLLDSNVMAQLKDATTPEARVALDNKLIKKKTEDIVIKIKENVHYPLKQNEIDAIVGYLYWTGSNTAGSADADNVKKFLDLVNAGDIRSALNHMQSQPKLKTQYAYLEGNRKRNLSTSEWFLDEKKSPLKEDAYRDRSKDLKVK